MPIQNAGALFREGRLDAAIEAAADSARQSPASADPRILLAELLLFVGELERADTVLDAAARIDPTAALLVAEFRQLLRAAIARRQVLTEGRIPDFLGAPTASQTQLLQTFVAMRSADAESAARSSAAAEQARPATSGQAHGCSFTDWRDVCDLWSGSFEVLTSTGHYYWVPTERVVTVEFHPPRRPRDLFWRRCTMIVRDGPDGDVYMPVLYGSEARMRDAVRLGRETEWTGTAPVRGVGQRMFLVGDEAIGIRQLGMVEFT